MSRRIVKAEKGEIAACTNKTEDLTGTNKTGVDYRANYYISKLEALQDELYEKSDVPVAHLEPIAHELNKLKAMFNNVLTFLP